MRIQHNIAALNSHRQLTSNNSAVGKNLEKLSSGYRINRAGDDAAGLAISEKMRAQITGLNTASKNAQDGISLVQTAEGALTEVHSMLNRMTELAGQAANGTYQDDVDRENAMKELDSLRSEIDRISDGTNFNGIKLLDGTLSSDGKTTSSAVSVKLDVPGAMSSKVTDQAAVAGIFKTDNFADIADGKLVEGDKISFTFDYTDKDGNKQSKTIELTYKDSGDDAKGGKLVAADGTEYTAAADAANVKNKVEKASIQDALIGELQKDNSFKDSFSVAKDTDKLQFTAKDAGVAGAKATGVKFGYGGATPAQISQAITETTKGANAYQDVNFAAFKTYDGTNPEASIFSVNGSKFAFVGPNVTDEQLQQLKELGITDYVKVAANDTVTNAEANIMSNKINFATGIKTSVAGGGAVMSFKAGEVTNTKGGGLSLQIGESSEDYDQLTVSVSAMSTKALGINEINIKSQDGAKAAVDVIKKAINTVSSTRGDLGAIQNRLEHTINNLGVTAENMTAAESRIRDVDMAQEMMTYTKNNILTQASQAMLAQANQLPQGVLQLLQ